MDEYIMYHTLACWSPEQQLNIYRESCNSNLITFGPLTYNRSFLYTGITSSVKLKAFENHDKIFDSSYFLDEKGSGENTAMGKLVSITLSAAIDLIMDNKIESGVKNAPHKTEDIMYFFKILKDYKINIQQENG